MWWSSDKFSPGHCVYAHDAQVCPAWLRPLCFQVVQTGPTETQPKTLVKHSIIEPPTRPHFTISIKSGYNTWSSTQYE